MAVKVTGQVKKKSPICQMELVMMIAEHLASLGYSEVVPRQLNAIIDGVNGIIDEFGKPFVPSTAGMGLGAWLASDDTGLSSKYMASVLGGFHREYNHPHDADDFGRCVRLLEAVPEFADRLEMLRGKSKEWNALLDSWGAITDRLKADDYKGANDLVRKCVDSSAEGAK